MASASITATPTRLTMEKFDGKSNFGLWQIKMEDMLVQQGLHKALLGKEKSKVKTEDWEDFDRKAVSTIRLCLSDEVLYGVLGEKSAAGLWLKLESLYMTKSLTNRLYMKQKIYRFTKAENTTLQQHISEFNKLISELLSIDVVFEDQDQALLLLASLPSSFEHLVVTLLHGRDTISLEDVQASLLSHEMMKKMTATNVSKPDHALVATESQKEKKPLEDGCTYCKKSGHTYRDCEKLLERTQCYRCKKYGHRSNRCKVKMTTSEEQVGFVQDVEDPSFGFDCLNVVSEGSPSSHDEWILDSGCSYHVSSNRDIFTNLQPISGENILLGDDTSCEVTGVGSIWIQRHDVERDLLLDNVRFVPNLKRNLISLGKLDSAGCEITSQGGVMKVRRDGRILLKGRRRRHVFILEGVAKKTPMISPIPVTTPTASTASLIPSSLPHCEEPPPTPLNPTPDSPMPDGGVDTD